MAMNQTDARPPVARGRRRAGAESGREALLSAAMGAFARLGYEGSSLRALGAAGGVDMALVGRLFGSKAALWDAVVDRLAERQAEQAEQLANLADMAREDPDDAFRRFIRFFADLSFEMPAFPAFLLQEAANPGDRLDALVSRLVKPFRDRCRPIIQAALDAGVVQGKDADMVFGMLVAAISLPMVSPALFTGQEEISETLRDALADEAIALFVRSA
jgi:AcrR family transcriptional regulator